MGNFDSFGKKVIVVEGGDVVINSNINEDDEKDSQLALVVLQDKGVGGSVYIADDVTTLANVAIIADKAVHPFYKLEASQSDIFGLIDSASGEIKDLDGLADFYRGKHKDDTYQLFIKGAISARTVKGISNVTKVEELPAGRGEITKNLLGNNESIDNDSYSVFRSMFFDWNAFRYYKGGDLQECLGGLTMDWSCGRCLTVGDAIAIGNGAEIFGAKAVGNPKCDTSGSFTDLCKCDGIQGTVHPGGDKVIGLKGDLIPNPDKQSPLARSYKPFYLYYLPVDSAILNTEGR